ncbi:MAG: hypothetical protein ACRDQ7_18620 [Haloechinothrix sp.]
MSSLLHDPSEDADTRWRALFARLMADGPSLQDMKALWSAILEFDPGLRAAIADPLPVPRATVIVAGSGKETLKTFNVSTAAAVLAAATGVPVVKGVSRSVSAVTGSADVLEQLGMPTCPDPAAIAAGLGTHGIAFVPYTAFCSGYGERYDGVFDQLTPVSFFAPVAVLAVRARAYVLGLADARVALADAAITAVRPDLRAGVVVSAEPVAGRVVDEYAAHGLSRMALRTPGCVKISEHRRPQAPTEWLTGVAHRADHAANADAVRWCLQPGSVDAARDLVERNAALILDASHEFSLSQPDALAAVRRARQDGRAAALLADIAAKPEAA